MVREGHAQRRGDERLELFARLHMGRRDRGELWLGLLPVDLDALARATGYAKERVVFERPIGMNQSIQHPLAAGWAQLEAARMMIWKAAALYDAGAPCGVEANAAKYLAAEAAQDMCRQSMATHGGMGYAREYHVERLFREVMIPYLAPVSQQLALCFIAERGLGLPKSY